MYKKMIYIFLILISVLSVININKSSTSNYNGNNETIAMYLLDGPNGNVMSKVITIEENYVLDEEKTTCTGTSSDNYEITLENQKLSLKTTSSIKCNIYFYEENKTYEGELVYLCPDGTYQNNANCTKPDVTNTITYTTPCDNCTTTYSCPDGGRLSESLCLDTVQEEGLCISCPTGWTIYRGCTCDDYNGFRWCQTECYKYAKSTKSGCTYGTRTITNSNATMACPTGYTRESITTSGTCNTVSGTCSAANTCTQTQSATCTAVGIQKYYCNKTNTYQDDITCYE